MKILITLVFFLIAHSAFSQFGGATVQRIDEIKNNSTSDIKLNPSGDVIIESGTVSTAVFLDANKKLKSSIVTDTELGRLSGVNANIQDQINSKSDISDTVALTGDQSIGGEKTFTGKLITSSVDNGSIPCPSVTTLERDAMTPDVGECVYNEDTLTLNLWNGTDWVSAGGGGISQWVTATDYKEDDIVIFSGEIYQALTDHTSDVFATDLVNGDWVKISDTFLFQAQNGSELKKKKLEAPNNQLTDTGTNTVLLETNNKNLLVNSGFEHSTYDTGWTTTGSATVSGTTSASEVLGGRKSFKAVMTGNAVQLTQDSTLYAATLANTQMFIRMVYTNTAPGAKMCVRKNGVTLSGTNDCVTLATDGVRRTAEIAFLGNGTSNGFDVDTGTTAGTLIVDDVELSTESSAFVDVAQIGPWIDYGPITITATTTNPTKGTTAVDSVECRVNGSDYECKYIYRQTTAGANGSGDYLFSLPAGIEFSDSQNLNTTINANGDNFGMQSAYLDTTGTGAAVSRGLSMAFAYSPSRFRLRQDLGGVALQMVSSSHLGLGAANISLAFTIKFRGKGLSNKVTTYSQQCVRDVDCENVFSAKVSAASPAVVSHENLDFIEGNCTRSGGSLQIATCTFKTGIFTVAPNCTATNIYSGAGQGAFPFDVLASSTNVVVSTIDHTGAAKQEGFTLSCQKQGADFKAKNVITGTFKDVVTSPNAGKVALCSAKISATGVISDQIGGCFASCTNATTPVCTFTSNYWVSGSIPNCWGELNISSGSRVGNEGEAITTTTTFLKVYRNNAGTAVSTERSYFCSGLAQ